MPPERQGTIIEMICTRGEADDWRWSSSCSTSRTALTPATKRKVVELLTDAAVTRQGEAERRFVGAGEADRRREAAKDRRTAGRGDPAGGGVEAGGGGGDAAAHRDRATRPSESLQQAALDGLVAIGGTEQPADDRATGRRRQIDAHSHCWRPRRWRGSMRRPRPTPRRKCWRRSARRTTSGRCSMRCSAARRARRSWRRRLQAKPPPADAAKLALRHMYSVGRSDQALSDVLSKAAGIALDAPPPSPEEVAKIAAEVAAKGDAARGEKIFRRADLSCLKCHAVGAGRRQRRAGSQPRRLDLARRLHRQLDPQSEPGDQGAVRHPPRADARRRSAHRHPDRPRRPAAAAARRRRQSRRRSRPPTSTRKARASR